MSSPRSLLVLVAVCCALSASAVAGELLQQQVAPVAGSAGPRRQTLAHRELLQMPCHQAQTPPIKAAAATKPKVAPSAAAATATKPTQPQKAAATTQTPAASAGRTKPVALKASAAIRQLLQQDQGSIRQLLQAPAAPKVAPKPQRRPFATGRLPGLAPKQQRAPRRTQG